MFEREIIAQSISHSRWSEARDWSLKITKPGTGLWRYLGDSDVVEPVNMIF